MNELDDNVQTVDSLDRDAALLTIIFYVAVTALLGAAPALIALLVWRFF